MGLLNIRKLTVSAVMLVLCTAQQMRGNSAYLKQIGPSPLRFSLASASFSFVLPSVLTQPSATTNSTEIANTTPDSTATNIVALQNPAQSHNFPVPPTPDSQNNSTETPSASDMLVVSPQMLTEYFKPGPDGTNSVNTVILPVPVGFTPPSAKPSSQAIYKSP
jgi:hypothetical protein